jgi:hypothetical protein
MHTVQDKNQLTFPFSIAHVLLSVCCIHLAVFMLHILHSTAAYYYTSLTAQQTRCNVTRSVTSWRARPSAIHVLPPMLRLKRLCIFLCASPSSRARANAYACAHTSFVICCESFRVKTNDAKKQRKCWQPHGTFELASTSKRLAAMQKFKNAERQRILFFAFGLERSSPQHQIPPHPCHVAGGGGTGQQLRQKVTSCG